ncbi:MAG: Hsp70 family protein [Planctomycetota bacterium]
MTVTARYSVGIDLGTTNSVVAYAALDQEEAELALLPIPQIIQPGQIESRDSLPSFLYVPRDSQVDLLAMPWTQGKATSVVGHFARDQAAENPQRVVVAAKSWLCHGKVGRTEALLPWESPADVAKVSAFECTQAYLAHLVGAWHAQHPDAPLQQQHVVLTVPASFDPAARELTRQAALAAGFPDHFLLLEEPQAAVYRWLGSKGDAWRKSLSAGDVLLVVDVGGGTTDLTLVSVAEESGDLNLERLAVGNHLLVGGDNMDLAIAHFVGQRFSEQGHELDVWQSVSLWHACRDAKEQLLAPDGPEEQTISVLGRGSSLIGGTISTKVRADEVESLLMEGFFPECPADATPQRNVTSGFQDIGLPYESDPAITKQLAAFLAGQHSGDDQHQASHEGNSASRPTHLLFNGGVFRSPILRTRTESALAGWIGESPEVLGGPADLETSVAVGAAYYGWSKQKGGIRIRGGTARSYYVGIETAGLAIPGAPRPLRALCVAPRGMEEGSEAEVPSVPVGLVVGQTARFRFFSSTVRPQDTVGTQLNRISSDLVENDSIETKLDAEVTPEDPFVPVQFVSRVTELGMFELWCHSTRNDDRWKMEFSAREE